jgi:putative transposase
MSHFYSEIRLHLTWHTKDDRHLLTPEVEKVAHEALRCKALSFRGVLVHAVGGTEDLVHAALSIPPTVLVSELIGQMKGYSSHEVNQGFGGGAERFAWQSSYGVVSFGTRDLPWVVRYVENQKQHHARRTTFERLERVEGEEDGSESSRSKAPG